MGYYSSGRVPRVKYRKHKTYINAPMRGQAVTRRNTGYREKFLAHNKGLFGFYICRRCHRIIGVSELEVDHIIPKSKGGSDGLYNLQPMCRRCNRSKSNNTSDTAPDLVINVAYNFVKKALKGIAEALR